MRFVRYAFCVAASTVPWAGAACVELKGVTAEEAPDGAGPAAIDAASEAEASLTDGGAPPPDFACGPTDAWTLSTKARPECAARTVIVVEKDGVIGATGVSIARTPAGRIGITYNAEMGDLGGEMHLAHFMASSRRPVPEVLKRQKGDFVHAGWRSRIAASAPDELDVIAHDVDDGDRQGDVVLVRLVGGAAPMTAEQLVAGAVAWPSEIATTADSAGTIYASVRIRTGTVDGGTPVAKLAARRKVAASAGPFEPLPDIATNLLPGAAPETGAASLVVDATGLLHVAYHHCDNTFGRSSPRYRSFDGASWTAPKDLELTGSHQAGASPRLAVSGTRKLASFFFRKQFQTVDEAADLHLVRWEFATESPAPELVDQAIASPTPLAPRHRAAMAVDKFGLVHIALVRPQPSNQAGPLEYLRQTRGSDGLVRWLTDIVDPNVLSGVEDAFVDLIVDEAARPHIAYLSGADLKVRYATRFDR